MFTTSAPFSARGAELHILRHAYQPHIPATVRDLHDLTWVDGQQAHALSAKVTENRNQKSEGRSDRDLNPGQSIFR